MSSEMKTKYKTNTEKTSKILVEYGNEATAPGAGDKFNNDKEQMPNALEMIVKINNDEKPIFYAIDGNIEIAKATDGQLSNLKKELESTGLRPEKSDGFVKSLARSFGGRYSEIFGFRPVPLAAGDNNTDDTSVDLLFGRVYMPTAKGFTTRFGVSNRREKSADISIKVNGIGAGGSRTYACTLTQTLAITEIPIDLVIPATIKITKFQNSEGDTFYVFHPINISRRIIARRTINPYDSDKGYEELRRLPGILDQYDTTMLAEPQQASEKLERSSKFNLTANIVGIPNLPIPVSLSGTATVLSTLEVTYTIPVGHEFAAHVQNEKDFNHIWAKK